MRYRRIAVKQLLLSERWCVEEQRILKRQALRTQTDLRDEVDAARWHKPLRSKLVFAFRAGLGWQVGAVALHNPNRDFFLLNLKRDTRRITPWQVLEFADSTQLDRFAEMAFLPFLSCYACCTKQYSKMGRRLVFGQGWGWNCCTYPWRFISNPRTFKVTYDYLSHLPLSIYPWTLHPTTYSPHCCQDHPCEPRFAQLFSLIMVLLCTEIKIIVKTSGFHSGCLSYVTLVRHLNLVLHLQSENNLFTHLLILK